MSGLITSCRFEQNQGILVDEVKGNPHQGDIFFLHGWGGNRDSLRELAGLFEHSYRVHLIDLPGFGDAPPPPPTWGTVEYAKLFELYLQQCVSTRVVLVGHSFGGRVAVRTASQRNDIAGLVLIGVPGLPIRSFSRKSIQRFLIRALRKCIKIFQPLTGPKLLQWHTNRFGSKDYLKAGNLRTVLVQTVNEDLTQAAKGISCPALLIWGCEDTETPPTLAHRYSSLLHGKSVISLLPHKDHFPFQGTGAHLCALKIRAWLETDVN